MDTPLNIPKEPSAGDTPKKYIRTFAGDIETIQKGEVPNLKPLTPPAEAYPAESPVQPAPPAAPAPVSTPEPPLPSPPSLRKHDGPLNILERPPAAPKPSPLQTYSGDFSQRVKETNASTATILAAEQDARPRVRLDIPAAPSRRNTLFVVAGVVLVLLGAAGAYVGYARYAANTTPVVIAPTVSAPIFVDEKEKISGVTPAETLMAIQKSTTRPLSLSSVRLLYTDSATTTGNNVFLALHLSAPDILLRNVNAASGMAGVVRTQSGQSPFFILSVASYGDTFAGMLSWEPAMPRDLSALFPAYATPSSEATTTAATTTAKTAEKTATTTPRAPIATAAFHDEVIANHDVRAYRDAEGRSVFVYGYWDQTTLIIARDPEAFAEIVARLATSRGQN